MDENTSGGGSRPAALDNLSETQLEELDRQYGEGDKQYWGELTSSYGWSQEDSDAVWNWFSQAPVAGHPAPTGGAWTSEGEEHKHGDGGESA